jgi:hypothetical protein
VSLNALLAVIQTLSLVALVVYVVKTSQIASATRATAEVYERILLEMQDARRAEVAPYVVVYFDVTKKYIFLVVKNIGKSVATNLKLAFDPPFQNTEKHKLPPTVPRVGESSLIKRGLETLPPGYELRLALDHTLHYMNVSIALNGVPPLTYYVTATYGGGLESETHTMKYTLDLTPYIGFLLADRMDTES